MITCKQTVFIFKNFYCFECVHRVCPNLSSAPCIVYSSCFLLLLLSLRCPSWPAFLTNFLRVYLWIAPTNSLLRVYNTFHFLYLSSQICLCLCIFFTSLLSFFRFLNSFLCLSLHFTSSSFCLFLLTWDTWWLISVGPGESSLEMLLASVASARSLLVSLESL